VDNRKQRQGSPLAGLALAQAVVVAEKVVAVLARDLGAGQHVAQGQDGGRAARRHKLNSALRLTRAPAASELTAQLGRQSWLM